MPAEETAPVRRHKLLRTIGSYIALTAGAIVVLFPIYVTVVNSLLKPDQLVEQPPPLIPTSPQWHNYTQAWTTGQMSKYIATSAIMTVIIVAGQILTSILAAYAFAFLRFPFKRTLFVICLATLMIPLEVTFITNLDTITSLGWFNSYEGLAIPFLATGFGIFLLRQAFLQIPRDLQEAAQLDGYGHLRFMTRVAVPLARPSLAALGRLLVPGRLEPVPVAAGVDRRDGAALHRPDRTQAAAGHPGVPDPRVARRRGHRLRPVGDPAARVPEAAGAQPDGRGGQIDRLHVPVGRCDRPTSCCPRHGPWC